MKYTCDRCYFCGKFIGYASDKMAWTPYGGYFDLDPPDEEFAHLDCFERSDTRLIHSTSYFKPSLIKGCKI